jgi:hypothetical protein
VSLQDCEKCTSSVSATLEARDMFLFLLTEKKQKLWFWRTVDFSPFVLSFASDNQVTIWVSDTSFKLVGRLHRLLEGNKQQAQDGKHLAPPSSPSVIRPSVASAYSRGIRVNCSSSVWAQENTRSKVFRLFTEVSFPPQNVLFCLSRRCSFQIERNNSTVKRKSISLDIYSGEEEPLA